MICLLPELSCLCSGLLKVCVSVPGLQRALSQSSWETFVPSYCATARHLSCWYVRCTVLLWGLSAQDGTAQAAVISVKCPNVSSWMYSCTAQHPPCGPILPDTSALCRNLEATHTSLNINTAVAVFYFTSFFLFACMLYRLMMQKSILIFFSS